MVINSPVHFRIDTCDPRRELWNAIRQYVKSNPRWIDDYGQVAAWLSDNQSRGMICVGSCGLGKSVICCQALPWIFRRHLGLDARVVSSTEMNQQIDDLLKYCGRDRIIIIDDLGQEAARVYGRRPFCELVNKAETSGTLLVITTNLRTSRDPDRHRNYPSIEDRYGIPTLDRLRAITKVVVFRGESMRGRASSIGEEPVPPAAAGIQPPAGNADYSDAMDALREDLYKAWCNHRDTQNEASVREILKSMQISRIDSGSGTVYLSAPGCTFNPGTVSWFWNPSEFDSLVEKHFEGFRWTVG